MAENEYTTLISECPESPNCVSTLTDQDKKKMQPISFEGSVEQAKSAIEAVLKDQSRVKLEKSEPNFIHAVFTTFLMRYKDDVYFYIDTEAKLIHFRSQSRTGYSDLGKNRSRMEELTKLIKAILFVPNH